MMKFKPAICEHAAKLIGKAPCIIGGNTEPILEPMLPCEIVPETVLAVKNYIKK